MRIVLFFTCLFAYMMAAGQQRNYTNANIHSHNDYERARPLQQALEYGVGSVEADIFLEEGKLIVAHDRKQVLLGRTLDSLYLQPLQKYMQEKGGLVYADTAQRLQLMIDIKTEAMATLNALVEVLKAYPELIDGKVLSIVISGNRPSPDQYKNYPIWIRFDGELRTRYTTDQWNRVAMISDNFSRYSQWKGKGRLPEKDGMGLKKIIDSVHHAGKKIRFWNAPDLLNSWYQLTELGVDYLNTDDIPGVSAFLKDLPNRIYRSEKEYMLYQPQYRNDAADKPVKNIILLIGDGTGLAQWYAGYTANRGKLNVFQMKHTGLSKTSSFSNYVTDSAPGATAFSTGRKTNNRSVGVDSVGQNMVLLPEILARRQMKTGIITSGDFRDATPASFYAHQSERSRYLPILNDLLTSHIDLMMGACDFGNSDSVRQRIAEKFLIYHSLEQVKQASRFPFLVADKKAATSVLNGRGNWLEQAFTFATKALAGNGNKGFFLMLEAAQVDHGGHANKLPYAVSELLDFDQLIGRAMQFADSNGETLIIVTGDHETGGLTLTDGDYQNGMINGQFSTGHHTAVPVPVFAYGPHSYLFDGVYENVEIFQKILQALGIKDRLTD